MKRLITGILNTIFGVFLFYIVGLDSLFPYFFVLIGLYLIYIGVSQEKSRPQNIERTKRQLLVLIDSYRKKWMKIKVDYEKCTIKNYGYSYEKEINQPMRVTAMNVASGNEMNNVKNVNVSQLLLEYPVSLPGYDNMKLHILIQKMDKDTFDMQFIKDDIYIYIDKENYDEYFIDFGDLQIWGSSQGYIEKTDLNT